MREQRLVERAYCVRCRHSTGWSWDGGQNSITPQADYWRCLTCGHRRLQLANVTDVFALCRYILDRESKRFFRDIDRDDALGNLTAAVWELFSSWRPERNASFLSYASWKLGNEFWNWIERTYGLDAPHRRHYLKTQSFEVSLDALAASYSRDGEPDREVGDVVAVSRRRGLGSPTGTGEGDPGEDRDAALRRAIEQGNRAEARGEGVLGLAQARRAKERDRQAA